MKEVDHGRLLTAMVTPFNSDGAIEWAAVDDLVEYLIAHNTEGLVVAGTTGESPTLSTEEKLALFKRVKEAAGGRVPVIAGTGTNDTAYSAELTQKASSLGVDGIMAVTPYYNKPTQEGMYHHFKAIAESTSLPVMIYNIPGRCIVDLHSTTLLKLSHIPNITSVKEANGNLEQMAYVIENAPKDFKLYSGDDSLTLPVLSIGGHGVVSVAAHLIGREMSEMIGCYLTGDITKAAGIHRGLLPKMKACFITPNPAPIKGVLEQKGILSRTTRSPILPLTDPEMNWVRDIFLPA
ncbi:4-hydroxy-tetrahydrodipicolinate synthase [Bacillus sp. FJAT-44742]|uniref:4-hydroxy-tetrahydrodipicolinate synthase n=1 Tax=Bacillus sp. FJAT-44742 TaxID=2014005 RepID=UPI000C237E83|nr:4-hydroxy-tetrahydrodipicolinate synthase [Bacillus sp. FJAT-44742]